MNFKNKLKWIVTFILLVFFYLAFNYSVDSYGLFRSHQNLSRFKTFNNVMIDKWMFSFRYIPEHFDGILIGPAFSSNINTKNSASEVGIAVYNLSIASMNFSRIKKLINIISSKKRLKMVLISIDPYFTMDRSDSFFMPENILEAYGGPALLKRYFFEMAEYIQGKELYKSNNYGFVEYSSSVPEIEQEAEVLRSIALARKGEVKVNFTISNEVMNELKSVFTLLRNNGTKVVLYFHPRHIAFREYYKVELESYKNKIATLNTDIDYLIDFYDHKYDSFLSKNGNYTDIAHLSAQGADIFYHQLLLPELKKLNFENNK